MTEPDALDAAVALEADVAGLPDFRRMPVPDAILWLAQHGEPADPRPDVDTASLVEAVAEWLARGIHRHD